MDLILVSITGISLALTVAMGLIVFKLQREERHRAEARIALLAAAAGDEPPLHLHGPESLDDELARADEVPMSGEMFAAPDAESPWLRRAGVAAAVALAVVSAGYAMTLFGSANGPVRAEAVPLELVALQHAYEGDALTVSGTVLNPANATPASHIVVTALLLGPAGEVVASGRGPLDYATLAPGDESAFVIKIPAPGTVSRYRVGFRRPDGSVVAHVDRRTARPSARNKGSTEGAPWVR